MEWKTKKTAWVFLYIKYSKFWSVSLEHFVQHKPLISEEWLCVLLNMVHISSRLIRVQTSRWSMPSAFTFAYNLNVYFPTDQFILFSLGSALLITYSRGLFCFLVIPSTTWQKCSNVSFIVHTYVCISMCFSLNNTSYLNMKIQFNVHCYYTQQHNQPSPLCVIFTILVLFLTDKSTVCLKG